MYAIPELVPVAVAVTACRHRLDAAKSREDGYTTETIIITALLAALALFAVGLVVTQVRGTAGSIKTQ
jgi:hypothetical protein